MTDASESEADDKDTINPDTSNAGKRRTQSKVWGTDPMRRSGRLSTQDMSDKVLIAKSTKPSDSTDIITPRAYADAISLPEGKLWKDAMDYELTKLKEMNTWSEIDRTAVPLDAQILPGMWCTS